MHNFIFDVDGTLTPSRSKISPEFHDYFLSFCRKFNVYLVTGSDYPKTLEQLGEEILDNVIYSFNCAGNSIWERGKEIHKTDLVVEESFISFLKEKVKQSKFMTKGSGNIEYRPGMINFSIPGRPCSFETRHLYKQWDKHKQERINISLDIMEKYPDMVAQVAGETGIDIYPHHNDKSQVVEWIQKPITFFGDNMQIGGNDHPLAVALEGFPMCRSIQVKDWKDTYRYLRTMTNSV